MREKIINKRNIVILVIILATALIGSAIYASTNTKTTKSIKTPMTKEISSKKQEKKTVKKVESEKKEEENKDKEVKEEKKVVDNKEVKEVTSNKASNKSTSVVTKTPATTSNTPKATAQPQKKLITKIIHHHELGHTEERMCAADGTDITGWTDEQVVAYMDKINSGRTYNKAIYIIDRPAYDEKIQVWADISSPDVVEEWTDN